MDADKLEKVTESVTLLLLAVSGKQWGLALKGLVTVIFDVRDALKD